MNLTLHVWRQDGPKDKGRFARYEARDVSPDMSFLEMLDVLNESLVEGGEEPIAIDHDCREGICGTCGVVINGKPHGPWPGTATCQLHMREYSDGDQIWIEPWRAKAFPVIRDLVVDRTALDRIIEAGGYISVRTGKRDPGPEGGGGPLDGRGIMHWLRRLHRGLPQRVCHAVHVCQGRAPEPAPPGRAGTVHACPADDRADG